MQMSRKYFLLAASVTVLGGLVVLGLQTQSAAAQNAAPAAAPTLSKQKAGRWVITRFLEGSTRPSTHFETCLDQVTPTQLLDAYNPVPNEYCGQVQWRVPQTNVLESDRMCRFGKSLAHVHAEFTFSGETAYRSRTTVRYQPDFFGLHQTTTTTEARWASACTSTGPAQDLSPSASLQ